MSDCYNHVSVYSAVTDIMRILSRMAVNRRTRSQHYQQYSTMSQTVECLGH